MTTMRRWSVEIYIDEHEDSGLIHAEARLHTNDPTHLVGQGDAHPADDRATEIGDELAVARALSDLAHQLVHAVARDLEDAHKRLGSTTH